MISWLQRLTGKCPHCGSSNIRRRYRQHKRYNWRCRRCNRVFRRPKRSARLWVGVAAVIVMVVAYALRQDIVSIPSIPALVDESVDSVVKAVAYTATPKPTRTPWPTYTPRPTRTPTPTQIPERPDLYTLVDVPEHMSYTSWEWGQGKDRFRELEVELTIHNDIGNFSNEHGIYMMLGSGDISSIGFYFGIQTDVYDPNIGRGRGKGLIFSGWDTRDLANVRLADGGWSESSGHEGDFVGVRRQYDWSAGDYRISLAPDGTESDGEWFSLRITDIATEMTTWIGALKFPYSYGTDTALIESPSYSTIEIYGDRKIHPIDIPELRISIKPPTGDGVPATSGYIGYSAFEGEILNSDAIYDRKAGVVHLQAGGLTERTTKEGWIDLE